MSLEKIIKTAQKIGRKTFPFLLSAKIFFGCDSTPTKTNMFDLDKDKKTKNIVIETTHPYYDPKIETQTDITNFNGVASLITPSKTIEVRVENEYNQPLNSIQVDMLTSPQQTIITANDFSKKYLPSILFPSTAQAKPVSSEKVIQLFEAAKNKIGDIAIKYLSEKITNSSYFINPQQFADLPFVIKEENGLSFNDLMNNTELLISMFKGDNNYSFLSLIEDEETRKGLGVIALAFDRNPTTILNAIDVIADIIELNTSFDKSKPLSIYKIPELNVLSFLPFTETSSIFDVKYYLPTQPNNEWTYYMDLNTITVRCLGTEKIKGKELVLFESYDQKEYYGFNDDELRLYGFYDSGIGDILFKPSISIGDNNIRLGRSYRTDSEIIIENHPEITGSITEIVEYVTLEDVIVEAGPFGDCLKIKETAAINLMNKNTKETFSDTALAYHWLAKNIGKVKMEILESEYLSHSIFKLGSAYVNKLSLPKIAQTNHSNQNLSYSLLPYLIRKALD